MGCSVHQRRKHSHEAKSTISLSGPPSRLVPRNPSFTVPVLTTTTELRNRTYTICQEAGPDRLIHTPRVPGRKAARKDHFFHLAHADHQIRSEFLPLYMAHLSTPPRFEDASAWVLDFLQPQAIVPNELTIEVGGSGSGKVRGSMLGLLNYLKQERSVKLRLVRYKPVVTRDPLTPSFLPPPRPPMHFYRGPQPPRLDDLQSLLEQLIAPPTTYAEGKWEVYMDKAVKEVWVSTHEFPFLVTIVVKSAETAWWMDGTGKAKTEVLNDWKRKTGWPLLERVAVLSVSGER